MSSASCGSRGASRSVSWVSSSSTVASSSGISAAKDSSSAASSRRGFQVAAGGLQLAIGRDDRRDLREPAADLAGRRGIGVQIRVGELTLEVGLLGQQRINRRRGVRHVRPPSPERKPTPGLRSRARSGVGKPAICRQPFSTGLALAVALLEAGHAAAAVEDLLLAGVERVALRADLDVDLSALLRAARGERVAAAAVHRGLDVVRVNTRFHGFLFNRGPRVAPPRSGGIGVNRNRGVDGPLCQLNRQQPKRVPGGSYSSAERGAYAQILAVSRT